MDNDAGELHPEPDAERMDADMAPISPRDELANRITAAREYAGLSRKQLGDAVGRSAEQIGRYERAVGAEPGKAIIAAMARACLVPEWFITEGFGLKDPATSFEEGAQDEARRQRGHPGSEPGDAAGGDGGDRES